MPLRNLNMTDTFHVEVYQDCKLKVFYNNWG
jgi:hypothetical protein